MSVEQFVVTACVMNAEFVACFGATIMGFYFGFVDNVARLLKIYCHDPLAVMLSNYDKYYKCAMDMEIKYLMLKRSSEIEIVN